jgi:hypothetical protein
MISFQSRAFDVVSARAAIWLCDESRGADLFWVETMTILRLILSLPLPTEINEPTMLHCENDENCFSVENGERRKTRAKP